jgi:hypothetical protein
VAFRESVFAKTFDLAKAMLGEFAVIATRRHSVDELVFKKMDGSVVAEGCHGAAQTVGLVGCELRRRNGDLHRLLLEQRHAERAFENVAQFVGRSVHRVGGGVMLLLDAVAPAQIGMHHVALDRTRAHDRNFNHKVVEALRLEPRQHRHLRTALDLKYADRVGTRQHLVDFWRIVRSIFRNTRQRIILAVMDFQKVEPAAQAAQHAERKHIDLHQTDCIDVVLVPFDEGTVCHGGVGDRHRFIEPPAGEDETADVLREVAWEAGQFVGEFNGLPDQRICRIEAGLADVIVGQFVAGAPHCLGERCGDVLGQAKSLADFTDGAARTVMHDS